MPMSSFITKMREKEAMYICPFIYMLLGTITIAYLHLTVAILPVGGALKVSTKKLKQIQCKSALLLCTLSPLINEVAYCIQTLYLTCTLFTLSLVHRMKAV